MHATMAVSTCCFFSSQLEFAVNLIRQKALASSWLLWQMRGTKMSAVGHKSQVLVKHSACGKIAGVAPIP